MEKLIPDQLTVLGHPQRLAAFRLLMRRYPDHVPAGELAGALGVKASTLSNYVAALQRVGLVSQHRAGTSLRYAVDMTGARQMFGYLLNDCGRARADLGLDPKGQGDSPLYGDPTGQGDSRRYNVLFICTGNSARSIFAEVILRDLAGDRFTVQSAGSRARTAINPFAVQVLHDKGHDVSGLHAKGLGAVSGPDMPTFDFVFTVCNAAANEDCPAWDGQPISGHWGVPDPVAATGTEAERSLAFQQAYGALRRRIEAFAALPVDSLDRIALQSAVDDIARLDTKETT